ncbi:MAG: YncE family protein, partial [Acidimicrobiales bacterium]
PDGSKLYVANSNSNDVSVVDLALRREVRRITLPSIHTRADRPLAIAVAANGTALVTTRSLYYDVPERLLQIDLATSATRERTDMAAGKPMVLGPSGDHTRIGLTRGHAAEGAVSVYVASLDSFVGHKEVAGTLTAIALDADGSKMLLGFGSSEFAVGSMYVLDQDLVRRATIPTIGWALGVSSDGTIGYRVRSDNVDVIDLTRAQVVESLSLPEGVDSRPTKLAVSRDNAFLAVLTPSGVSIVETVDGTPAPACTPWSAPTSVVAVCNGPLAEVVVDATGHAYASNPNLNQIEVVSLATGTRGVPTPVGSRPRGLDLSADGSTLYVANSGVEELSVVDLGQRRETRRITLRSLGHNDRPTSIAVAANGRALLTTEGWGGGRVLELDLTSETAFVRRDFGAPGTTGHVTIVKASGDRSHIAIVGGTSEGVVTLYASATNSFTAVNALDAELRFVGLDRDGSRLLIDPGGHVLDGALQAQGAIPSGGKGVAVDAEGILGYRVQENSVEVLDLDRRAVLSSIPLPEPVGPGRGAIALSRDGATLAVLTRGGLSIVPTQSTIESPHAVWAQAATTGLDGLGTWIGIANTPVAGPGQLPPAYLYGHYFGFANSTATGVVGLITGPTGRSAVFAVVAPDGTAQSAAVPFDWRAGRLYFPLVHQLGPGSWGAWMYDHSSGAWTFIGHVTAPVGWGKLSPTSATSALWYEGPAPTCSAYPRADVLFHPAIGYLGTTAAQATLTTATQSAGDCAAQNFLEAGVWSRYRLGA